MVIGLTSVSPPGDLSEYIEALVMALLLFTHELFRETNDQTVAIQISADGQCQLGFISSIALLPGPEQNLGLLSNCVMTAFGQKRALVFQRNIHGEAIVWWQSSLHLQG